MTAIPIHLRPSPQLRGLSGLTGRNIRPKADKPLPVVDFKREMDAMADEECEECSGEGTVDVDCDTCAGMAADDEGNPCKRCDGMGVLSQDCRECDGTGRVATDSDDD